MITQDEALRIVQDYLRDASSEDGMEMVVVPEETIEREFGWVFFYDLKANMESPEKRDPLAGNAPIIVDRRDGALHETGTAEPVEYYIGNYERSGSPYGASR